ncbi:SMP-30/gluconolactonase/LRE family protein [Paraburkholderia terrae]
MAVPEFHVSFCTDLPLEIGESPLWDNDRGILWFVDIAAHAIYSFEPVKRTLDRFEMPAPVGSIGLTTDKRLVVALKTGVHLFDPVTGALDFLVNPEADRPGNRLNDGKVGPDGCFWVGSMDENSTQISGALYRIEPSGQYTRVRDGLFAANGLAWSPNGQTMYHADGLSPSIKAFDFDPYSGAISNERDFVTLDTEEYGWPDGATIDIAGNYWSAGIFKGRINQISPQGELLLSLQMPIMGTTMPCLGGIQGKTLFVTSLSAELDDVLQQGALLACEVDVEGLPAYRFTPATH